MGYQKKGYTSGDIGIAWLEDWDKLTSAKAAGRYRLLIVDGHSSHYTMGFLDHDCNHKIIVLCYPSHSTHVYQGLDVVIFSILKRTWSDERDKFEKNGSVITKLNFMSIYAKAHVRAFTKDNIHAAFRKTGVVPFNPDVVTDAMMAPSLETSTSSILPLRFTSPVQTMIDLISHHQARKRKREDDIHELEGQQRTPPSTPTTTTPFTPTMTSLDTYTPVRRGLNALASTSASFLVSDSPIASTSRLPPVHTFIISPNVHPKSAIDLSMESEPLTERETLLMAALNDSYQCNIRQKEIMIGMQAQSLLQALYVENVRIQLQTQEEKKDGGKRKGCINMDGKAKILTQDDIFKAVVEGQTARDAAKDALLKRKDAKERYSDAVGVWKVREMDRREKNTLDKEGWKTEVKKWEVE